MTAAAALVAVLGLTFPRSERGRTDHGTPNASSGTLQTKRRFRQYDYTLDLDLVDLRSPTIVRITVEDVDGDREVQSRRRSPGERFSVEARAKGEEATWRVYYSGTLVKTLVAAADGTSKAFSSGRKR